MFVKHTGYKRNIHKRDYKYGLALLVEFLRLRAFPLYLPLWDFFNENLL